MFEDDPLYNLYANKCFAPYFAKAKIPEGLKFAQRCGLFKSITADDFDAFPERFVMKLSHGSGVNEIVKDKQSIDQAALANKFNRAIRTTRNAQLKRDPDAAIIVEESLTDDRGAIPNDFKFHCFHNQNTGVFDCVVQVGIGRFGQYHRNFYDADLNQIDLFLEDANPTEGSLRYRATPAPCSQWQSGSRWTSTTSGLTCTA